MQPLSSQQIYHKKFSRWLDFLKENLQGKMTVDRSAELINTLDYNFGDIDPGRTSFEDVMRQLLDTFFAEPVIAREFSPESIFVIREAGSRALENVLETAPLEEWRYQETYEEKKGEPINLIDPRGLAKK